MRDDRMMDIIIGIAESLTLHHAKADFPWNILHVARTFLYFFENELTTAQGTSIAWC